MTRWLRQQFRTSPKAPIVQPQRSLLGVHALEDRVVPAVTVANLDVLFDTDGKLNTDFTGSRADTGRAIAIQDDGKIVVAGSFDFDTPGGAIDFAVLRYNPNGTLDTTFDTDGKTNIFFDLDGSKARESRATTVAIQSDGKIVVGGFITTVTTGRDAAVFRLNPDGKLDTSFDGDGRWHRPTLLAGNDEINALAIQPNGQIVTVGYSTVSGTNTDFYITRLNEDGVVDSTLDRAQKYDAGGTNADVANAVAIAPNGNIIVVGTSNTGINADDMAVMVCLPDGSLDSTFDVDGLQLLRHDTGNTPDRANAVIVQGDGKYLIGGSVQLTGKTDTDFAVFRLNPNGTYDETFDVDGKQTIRVSANNDIGTSLGIQSWDGRIVIGGRRTTAGTDTDFSLGRVDANGTLDTTFAGVGFQSYTLNLGGTNTDDVSAMAIDSAGRITMAGTSTTAASNTDVSLIRVYGRDIPLIVDSIGDDTDFHLGKGSFSLREAIFIANIQNDVDTITFSEGLNGNTITLGGTRLEVRRAVNITGPSLGVTIDANLNSQLFYFDGRTNGTFNAALTNLMLVNGKTGDNEEILDTFNSGNYGGGIFNDRTNLTLNYVTMANNQSSLNGGAISNWQNASSKLTINNSLFVGNSANYGGAIHNWVSATVAVANSTFSANTSIVDGGAIFQDGGAITLVNVTGTLNRADSDNNGSGNGGFLSINSGTVTMHNSIISGNLRGAAAPDEFGSSTLAAGSSFNIVYDAATAGGLINGTSKNQVAVNPLLGALLDNGGRTKTHAIGQGSPALGKGSMTVAGYTSYDQRGTARDNLTPDVGAHEVQHPLATLNVPTTLAALYSPKPSATVNEAFVKGLYQSTLLRAPDAAGLAGWLNLLDNGTTHSEVANGFVNSIENRSNQVIFFYRYFLGREADVAGLNGWVDILRSGTDEGTVMTGFILSDEFSGLNDNTQFVNLMYYALLSRQPDTGGFNGWLNALNAGESRGNVVNAFLRSVEGMNRVVNSQFQTYLKRYASNAELSVFRSYIANNTFGEAAVVILSSGEFYNNASNNLT